MTTTLPTITNNTAKWAWNVSADWDNLYAVYLNGVRLIAGQDFEIVNGVFYLLPDAYRGLSSGTYILLALFNTTSSTLYNQVGQQVEKTTTQDTTVLPYSDISTTAWYYYDVWTVYRYNLISGATSTTYDPNGIMTRAMMVEALYRLAGSPSTTTKNTFTDVSSTAWYAPAVNWAVGAGITQGTGDGTIFSPNSSIDREQMATMLLRYCEYAGIDAPLTTSVQPTDLASISSWAKDGAVAMYQRGILSGDGTGAFNPKSTAYRSAAAAMFSKFITAAGI